MSVTFDPVQLASLFLAARKTHQPVSLDRVGDGPQTFEEVYAVQSAVMAELGPNGGFKTARPVTGEPNVIAPIPAANVRSSPATYTRSEMRLAGVEIELAFRVDGTLPAPGVAGYDSKLRAAVSLVPVIEMVDSRLPDPDRADALLKLADNQSGFGLVTGAPIKEFAGFNLTNPAVTFTINGTQVGPTAGQIPGSVDAFQVLKDFLDVVGDHCGGVGAGMYITTGALTGLHWARHGDTISGSIEGLGDISVTVQA